MSGLDQFKKTGRKLVKEVKDKQVKQEKESEMLKKSSTVEDLTQEEVESALVDISSIYSDATNVGTAQIGSEELRTPTLSIIQKSTDEAKLEGIDNAKVGNFYRSDTNTAHEKIACNILCFKKTWSENYNKTGLERKHIYFGVFEGGIDPFRLYCRGWSLNGSRAFLTEVKMMQSKYGLPMFGMRVVLSTAKEQGTIADTGKPYTTYRIVFEIIKEADSKPAMEKDPGRAGFLKEKAIFFDSLDVGGQDEPEQSGYAQEEPPIEAYDDRVTIQ